MNQSFLRGKTAANIHKPPASGLRASGLWRLSPAYALWALLIFLAEVAIATVGREVEWLRWYAGDVIVVAWVHCLIAMVVAAPVGRIAATSLGIACLVELSQYICGAVGWQIQQPVLRIIVGSTADWLDVASYVVGAMLVPGVLLAVTLGKSLASRQRPLFNRRKPVCP
ncbi:ribosomal maturation YjgA family protein [Roseateles terrae]|uniref:DUF2809 domain-containing protein n=1 Tax=Roseateles terrae TaxID=431060 RepID=A0ABR6GP27_9BURK|nr:DUF2809 domain-containing protein [Roseateles terrae]MBB3193822.1 hypothetical protein [Roseateles terrae]OWQ89036.1 hypothetical protein CDN98_00290 [Roseateles terrae]